MQSKRLLGRLPTSHGEMEWEGKLRALLSFLFSGEGLCLVGVFDSTLLRLYHNATY